MQRFKPDMMRMDAALSQCFCTLHVAYTGLAHTFLCLFLPFVYNPAIANFRSDAILTWQMPAGGKTTTHALGLLEPRGVLFTGIQQEVYNGMIIGECSRDGEMEVSKSTAACYTLVSDASVTEECEHAQTPRANRSQAAQHV